MDMARKEPNMTSGGTTTTYLPTNNNNYPFQHLVGVAGIGSGNDVANITGNINNTMISTNHTATASNMGKFAHMGGCSSNSGGGKQLPAMGAAVAAATAVPMPEGFCNSPKVGKPPQNFCKISSSMSASAATMPSTTTTTAATSSLQQYQPVSTKPHAAL